MTSRKADRRSGLGCIFIIGLGLIVILLLVINSFVVKTFLDASVFVAEDLRVTQTLQFGLPVVLIVIEFWLFDFFKRSLR